MARYVTTAPVTVAAAGYQAPGRSHTKGQVVELSASEVTAITGAGGTVRNGSTARDMLGESFAVSN